MLSLRDKFDRPVAGAAAGNEPVHISPEAAELIGRYDHVTRLPNRLEFLDHFTRLRGGPGKDRMLVLFSLTVVSFPLLLDRDVDFVTAMVTSVRAVVASPVPMIAWAAVIVILLIVSALPYFLGLLVTVPVLGHATWHLYRRIVAPAV